MPSRSSRGRNGIVALGTLLFGAAIVGIVLLERRRPLRRSTRPEPRRTVQNLTLGALSMAVVAVLERPVVDRLARQSQARRRGLVQMLPARPATRDLIAVLMMDYTIYLWHVGTHRFSFLWRMHQVHHLDLDLDSTTALRFHFAEMVVSIPYRMLQIVLIGTSPRALTAWQRLFFLSILFHHSNLRLPERLERALALVLITPRMHGIHHSVDPWETNSNWSSGLSLWDRLHRTLRLDVARDRLRIGPPGGPVEDELPIERSVTLPFRRTAAPRDG